MEALRDRAFTGCHMTVHDLELDANDTQWRLRQSALAIHRGNYFYTATKTPKDETTTPLKNA